MTECLVPQLFCLDSLRFTVIALRRSMERQAPAWLKRHGAKLGLGVPSCPCWQTKTVGVLGQHPPPAMHCVFPWRQRVAALRPRRQRVAALRPLKKRSPQINAAQPVRQYCPLGFRPSLPCRLARCQGVCCLPNVRAGGGFSLPLYRRFGIGRWFRISSAHWP